jgi:hypothetical protein
VRILTPVLQVALLAQLVEEADFITSGHVQQVSASAVQPLSIACMRACVLVHTVLQTVTLALAKDVRQHE